MIKRTIEISREKAHLAVEHHQLLVKRDGQIVGQIPCEDIGVILVDQPQTTYTHSALASLAESDAALVICGSNHLPTAILLPLSEHSQVVWRVAEQTSISQPLRKRLWQQIVSAKIHAQAQNLTAEPAAQKKLRALANSVRSGDPSNVEAQAAKLYWQYWLGSAPFRRDADADGLNSLLNYGYAVLRAAVARALVAAGLLPSLGLHHCNRSNPFCLADDLMEPLRPLVDDCARELFLLGYEALIPEAKSELLKLLASDVRFGDETGPLMVSLHRYAASLVKCFQGASRRLEIPVLCS